ncbi:MAG: cyclic nucleotide-binding domain-containing protein [Myxococcaceae bacterium]|nr:cyclic nucleotide-binding domain-containing protein [Myxococcaceae bacterium]
MSDVRELKDKAMQLTAKGKLPAALEAWRKVVEVAADDVAARQKVAELLQKLGKSVDAVAAYEDVARRYAEQGQFFKASAVCRLILAIEPKHQRTLALIASLFAKSEKPLPVRPAAVPVAPVAAAAPAAVEDAIDIELEVVAPPTASGLPSIPLFSMLGEAELREVLASAMEVRAYGVGELIVKEGAPGESMFALVEGTVGVFRGHGTSDERRVASMSAGEIFGEVALVSKGLRVATVVTDDSATVLEFPRAAMDQVVAKHPRVGEVLDAFYRERLLANMMRASPVLRGLQDGAKKELARAFQPKTWAAGATIIAEGQAPEAVHVLLRGVCAVKHSSGNSYPDLREGDLFGEISILTGGPATATVTASAPVLTLELAAADFKALVMKDAGAAVTLRHLANARLERTARYDRAHGLPAGPDRRV